MSDAVLCEQRGAARWWQLNRPGQRNALNPDLIRALDQQLTDAENDPRTAAVVISGAGLSFCAGADLRHLLDLAAGGHTPLEFLTGVSALFTRIERSPLPVVAVVHGHAVAGGLELALACDVVIAADDAGLGDGHVRNQLLPGGGGSVRLPQRVGVNLARYLMLTGDLLPAHRFLTAGWLHAVLPADQLHQAAQNIVDRLVAVAGPAQSRIKPLLAALDRQSTDAAMATELTHFADHWDTAPIVEALQDFLRSRTVEPRA